MAQEKKPDPDQHQPDPDPQVDAATGYIIRRWPFVLGLLIIFFFAYAITNTIRDNQRHHHTNQTAIRTTLHAYAADAVNLSGPTPCSLMSLPYLSAFTNGAGYDACQKIFVRQREQLISQAELKPATITSIIASEDRQINQAQIVIRTNQATVTLRGGSSTTWQLTKFNGSWQFNGGTFAGGDGSADVEN